MALILELLHPDGTRTRHRLDGTPLVIGRALSSDVILDDPYVDARHARIALDASGALAIEDLASVNGLVAGSSGRQDRLLLHAGAELRLGRTVLRVRDEDEPVPPALVDGSVAGAAGVSARATSTRWMGSAQGAGRLRWASRLAQWSETLAGRIVISVAAFLGVGMYAWLGSYDRSTASEVLAGAFVFAMMAAMWAGIWSIASRVSTQRFNFVGHFAVVSAVTLAALAIMVAEEWYSFFVPQSALVGVISGIGGLVLLSAMITWHLSLSSRMSRDRRWRAGIMVSVTLVVIGGLFALVEEETFTDVPTFPGVVKPVGAGWLPTATVDDFGNVISELKDEVDELASPRP